MKEHYMAIPVDKKYMNNEDLLNASIETGKAIKELVDFIEQEFKVNRFKATLVVGAIIGSAKGQIQKDEEARNNIKEILEGLPNDAS